MKLNKFKVTHCGKQYIVSAKDSYSAVAKVMHLKDGRLSPMTYSKLKELGYSSEDWKKWNQEQANQIVARGRKTEQSSQKKEKEENSVNSKNNSTNSTQPKIENKEIDNIKKLAKSDNPFDRREVARDPKTPIDILKKLANDESRSVREELGKNPNAPFEILEKLSNDKDDLVKPGVARNPNTPVKLLEKLSEEETSFVRGEVARNPNTPADVLEKLSKDSSSDTRSMVAGNLNTPPEILKKLVNDKDRVVRKYASENPNTPKDVIKKKNINKSEIKFNVGASSKLSKDIENMFNAPSGEEYDDDGAEISDIEKRIKKMYPYHDIAVVGNYGWGEDDEETYENYQEVADWCNKHGYDYEFVNANRDVEDYEGDHWDIPAGRVLVISKKDVKQGSVRKALGDLLEDA